MAFKKGESGNVSGRPKDSFSLSTLLKKKLRENPEEADAIIQKLIFEAKKGNLKAIQLVFDRVDGKAPILYTDEEGQQLPMPLLSGLSLGSKDLTGFILLGDTDAAKQGERSTQTVVAAESLEPPRLTKDEILARDHAASFAVTPQQSEPTPVYNFPQEKEKDFSFS